MFRTVVYLYWTFVYFTGKIKPQQLSAEPIFLSELSMQSAVIIVYVSSSTPAMRRCLMLVTHHQLLR